MNTPSEQGLTNANENNSVSEDTAVPEESTPVKQKDSLDEEQEYVYSTKSSSRKKRKKSHHSHHSHHQSHYDNQYVSAPKKRTHTEREKSSDVREDVRIPEEKTPTDREKTNEVKEDVRVPKEKTNVQKDELTVRDEVGDFIFLKPRSHKKKHHHHHQSEGSSGAIKRVRRSKYRKRKKRKKIIIGVTAGLLAGILLTVSIFALMLYKGQNEMLSDDFHLTAPDYVQIDDGGRYVVYNGHTYKLNENIANMLLMGVDKRDMEEVSEYGSQGQADVIIMVAFDTKYNKITMINIPRDLMTDVPVYTPSGVYTSTKRQQICLAYAYGDGKEKSCENTVIAVERLFYNMPVKTYYAMDIEGIVPINDSIGGVDVVSPETIESFVQGHSYHLMGKQAERFVRARERETAEGNLKRNERQKVYASAFMSDLFKATKKDMSVPINLFNASSSYSVTNLNPSKITYLSKEMLTGGSPKTEMKSIEGEAEIKGDHAEFEYKEKEFYELFLSVYYEMVK